jgi:phosphate transport system protein
MALKVEGVIAKAAKVLETGDCDLAEEIVAGDDEIDDMLVSLTKQCYDILSTQAPVAGDLRLVVSVVRIVSDLERTADLCLRIAKLAPNQEMIASHPRTFALIGSMAKKAQHLFSAATRAWSTQDLRAARALEQLDDELDADTTRLMEEILLIKGPDAVAVAVTTLLAGRALERIADHSVMMGERLAYMLTGDEHSLSREVGP